MLSMCCRNPNLDDLCSKCNRERQANEAAAKAIASSAPSAVVAAPQQLPPVVSAAMQLPAAVSVPAVVAVQPQPQPAQHPAVPVQMQVPAPAAVAEPAVSPVATPQPTQQPAPAQLQLPGAQDPPSAAAAAVADCGGSQLQAAAPDEAADEEPPRRVQKNTNRCFSCNKKVHITCANLLYIVPVWGMLPRSEADTAGNLSSFKLVCLTVALIFTWYAVCRSG